MQRKQRRQIEMVEVDGRKRLPWLVRHSGRTLAIIRQNITFALAIKAVFVVLTFAGMASLWANEGGIIGMLFGRVGVGDV